MKLSGKVDNGHKEQMITFWIRPYPGILKGILSSYSQKILEAWALEEICPHEYFSYCSCSQGDQIHITSLFND